MDNDNLLSTDIPVPEKFYINSDATAVATKTLFDPTFRRTLACFGRIVRNPVKTLKSWSPELTGAGLINGSNPCLTQ